MLDLRRRDFVTLLGGAATWPLAASAQEGERIRRIGVLMSNAPDDPEGQARVVTFLQGLQQSGWTDGRNVRIEYRWATGDPDRFRQYAAELVAIAPDVILVTGSAAVGAGFVENLARPGGNATGFIGFEYGLSGKYEANPCA